MSELNTKRLEAIEAAIANGNAAAVKSLTQNAKELPIFLRSLARSTLSEHVLLGDSEEQLEQREEIEHILSKKQSFKAKLSNFFGLEGGRTRRRKRRFRNRSRRTMKFFSRIKYNER